MLSLLLFRHPPFSILPPYKPRFWFGLRIRIASRNKPREITSAYTHECIMHVCMCWRDHAIENRRALFFVSEMREQFTFTHSRDRTRTSFDMPTTLHLDEQEDSKESLSHKKQHACHHAKLFTPSRLRTSTPVVHFMDS